MKRKIFSILLIIILMMSILFGLTGCGKKEDKKQENSNMKEQKQEVSEGMDVVDETTKVQEKNLTVEKFKEVMKKHGLAVTCQNENDPNMINVLYQAHDHENATNYSLDSFKDEEHAIRYWDTLVKTRYENHVINVMKDESDDHTARLEKLISNGTYIDFRENNIILSVNISKDVGDEGVTIARNIIAELGY